MLELYYFPNATCGMKARLALNEKRVDYERRILDRDAGDLLTPQYRALNPNGVVPTMVHDGEILIESSIIMNYTHDAFDGPSLKPAHPLARARMAMWMKLADEHYFNSLANLTYATSQRANVLSKYRTDEEVEGYLSHLVGDDERTRRRNVLRNGIESPEAQTAIRTLDKLLADIEKVLRVRPETLCRITEFSEHESNGRELDEGERVAVEVLPVLGQSAAAVEPGDGAFDHPTPGLDDEALHPIGSLDDLGLEIGQDAGQGAVKDRALIGAVGEQFPEKGKQTEQGRQQRETAVAILNVGGGDDAVQQQAMRIDQNMPLLALDQLAGIEAVAVDASPPFSALFTL